MTRLLVGSCFTEELQGDPDLMSEASLQTANSSAQIILWFAKDDDVLVLPRQPEPATFDQITSLTGVRRDSLRVVVPPPGRTGADLLTADRLADKGFLAELEEVLAGTTVTEIVPLTPDTTVATLARALRLEHALPGYGFLSQGGGALVNSKAVFRAITAGAGAPLPEGAVCTNKPDAAAAIAELFAKGYPVMLKKDFSSGGLGNEIVSPVDGLVPVGAKDLHVLTDEPAVLAYLDERWAWLSNKGCQPVVVERYVPGSRAIFVEYDITDGGAEFAQQGEMMSNPTAVGQAIPSPDLAPGPLAHLVNGGARICESLRVLGYRGHFCADAIVTPAGDVMFTEFNARFTGSTHIYAVVGTSVVGPDYSRDRLLVEYLQWRVPSYEAAADKLDSTGLAYDPATRKGVVIVKAFNQADSTVRYCVVAEDLAEAEATRREVESLFTTSLV